MNKRKTVGMVNTKPKSTGMSQIYMRRKAVEIVNAAKDNNCEIIKVSQGLPQKITVEIKRNKMEVKVPNRLSTSGLIHEIKNLLRRNRCISVKVTGNGKDVQQSKSLHKKRTYNNQYPVLKNKDDGTGTGSRLGKKRR